MGVFLWAGRCTGDLRSKCHVSTRLSLSTQTLSVPRDENLGTRLSESPAFRETEREWADFGRFWGFPPMSASRGLGRKRPIRARKLAASGLPSGMERRLPEREVVEEKYLGSNSLRQN